MINGLYTLHIIIAGGKPVSLEGLVNVRAGPEVHSGVHSFDPAAGHWKLGYGSEQNSSLYYWRKKS